MGIYTYNGRIITYNSRVASGIHRGEGASKYSDEYQAVYDTMTNKPTSAEGTLQNQIIVDLKAGSVWSKMDYWLTMCGHSNADGEALINWKNPGTLDGVAYNDPVFNQYSGMQFNGTDNYVDTLFIPTSHGVNYKLNTASMFIYIMTDLAGSWYHGIGGNADLRDLNLSPRHASGLAYHRVNDAYSEGGAVSGGDGLYFSMRSTSTNRKLVRNLATVKDSTRTARGLPTHKFFIGAHNNDNVAANFRADRVAFLGLGDNFTLGEMTTIQNAMRTYLDAYGNDIIP